MKAILATNFRMYLEKSILLTLFSLMGTINRNLRKIILPCFSKRGPMIQYLFSMIFTGAGKWKQHGTISRNKIQSDARSTCFSWVLYFLEKNLRRCNISRSDFDN